MVFTTFLKRGLKGIFLSSLLIGCDPPLPPTKYVPNPPEERVNLAPNTEITAKFGDDGRVEYTFKGTDSDGYIGYIIVQANSQNQQTELNNSSRLIDIVRGSNVVKATAYDDKGLGDPTPAEYFFDSPEEINVRSFIDGVFASRTGIYKSFGKDVLISIGEKDTFRADYLIKRNDGKDAVVNFVGHGEDIAQSTAYQRTLTQFRIPNLFLVRLPQNEIQSRLNKFIDSGFN